MICPKCKEVICVPTSSDFIICPKCNEVIHITRIPIFDETYDSKDESSSEVSE
jgi:hypothetical protein